MKRSRFAVALGLIVIIAPVQAQTLTLVHGFGSDPSTWYNPPGGDAFDYLQQNFPNHAIQTPRYNSFYQLAPDVAQLATANPAGSILIGHSEGGVVSRLYAESNPLSGLITVGTPNYGANMATNYPMFLDHLNVMFEFSQRVSQEVGVLNPPWWLTTVQDYYDQVTTVLGRMQGITWFIEQAIGFVPVVADLQPYSPYFYVENPGQGQVNGWGLPEELANVPNRVSITYQDSNFTSAPAWRVAFGDAVGNDLGSSLSLLDGATWAVFGEANYEAADCLSGDFDCTDDQLWALQDLEWDSLDLALNLDSIDFEWCADVSMRYEDYWNLHLPEVCLANDLFIATGDQLAPGATQVVGREVKHTLETQQGPDIQQALLSMHVVP